MLSLIATVALGCSMQVPGPSLCFKEHVKIYAEHFEPEIIRILDVARKTAPRLGRGIVWITSANDSTKHIATSLHYKNRAFDIRIYNILGHRATEARLWAERMQLILGPNYDVVLSLSHIHVEYDPKHIFMWNMTLKEIKWKVY